MLLFAAAQETKKWKSNKMSSSLSPRRTLTSGSVLPGLTSPLEESKDRLVEDQHLATKDGSTPVKTKVRGRHRIYNTHALPYVPLFFSACLAVAADETILAQHMSVLVCVLFVLRLVNRRVVSSVSKALETRGIGVTYGGFAGSVLLWGVATTMYPRAGLVRLCFSLGLVVATVSFWQEITSQTFRLWLAFWFGLALCTVGSPPAVAFSGGAVALAVVYFLRVRWRKNDPDRLTIVQSGVQALAIAPVLALLACFLVYWAMLSMNWMWMEAPHFSKYYMLNLLGPAVSLNARELRDINSIRNLQGMKYPVVIKPSVCTTNSRNVKKCESFSCMQDYVETRAHDLSRGDKSWVIQDYHDGQEVVVFYYRPAYMQQGYIKTIGLRKNARFHFQRKALKADYFTSINVDALDLNTPEFRAFFDAQADKMKGYHGGRFDCVVDDVESAKQGKGIHILEVNLFPLGDIKEKVSHSTFSHIGFTRFSILEIRTWLLQFWIGVSNILGGYHGNPVTFLKSLHKLVQRQVECRNVEMLLGKP